MRKATRRREKLHRNQDYSEVRKTYRPGQKVTLHMELWLRHDHPLTEVAVCELVNEESGCGLRFWGQIESQGGDWPPARVFSLTFEGQIDPFAPAGRYECQLVRVKTLDGSYVTLPKPDSTCIDVLPNALERYGEATIAKRDFA